MTMLFLIWLRGIGPHGGNFAVVLVLFIGIFEDSIVQYTGNISVINVKHTSPLKMSYINMIKDIVNKI